jgi:hypothetical protein
MARVIAAITMKKLVVGGSAFRVSRVPQYADTTVFGAWPRSLFEKIGLFNEALTRNQDNEFNSRIRRYGGKIFQTPEIRIRYFNQATLRGLCRQAFRNGMWNILTIVANPSSFTFRHFAPFYFVLWLILFGLLSLGNAWMLVPLLLAVGAHLLLQMYVAEQVGRQDGWALAPLVPVAVAAYHVTYGLGTFAGIWRFLLFGRKERAAARAGSRIPNPDNPPKLGQDAVPIERIVGSRT